MSKHVTHNVTIDAIIEASAGIVLIKRKNEPFKDMWALPGGFVDEEESCESAFFREVQEETSIPGVCLDHFKLAGVYSNPGRDPRGHSISVVYYATISAKTATERLKAADDAIDIGVFSNWKKMDLAFDHKQMIIDALTPY